MAVVITTVVAIAINGATGEHQEQGGKQQLVGHGGLL
jgi:hypothetical protein